MGKHEVATQQKRKAEIRSKEPGAVEVARPASPGGFFGFSYSFTEVSMSGGKTHVTARQTRLEDSKLVSETFDGELDGRVYERMVTQAQQHLLDQAALLLRPLTWFLPASRRSSSERD